MRNTNKTTVQPLLRANTVRWLPPLVVTAIMLSAQPSLYAQTLQWDASLSFTGTADLTSANGVNLPTTVTMVGTGMATATPIGGGQYDVTSVFDVTTLSFAITGADFAVPSFNVAGSGITYTLAGYTTTFQNQPSGVPLAPGSSYSGTIAYSGPLLPIGGITTGGQGNQYAFFNGPTEFNLGDGSVPPVASGGGYNYGVASLDLNATIGGLDPMTAFDGMASVTFSSLGSVVPDSSSSMVEALFALAAGYAFSRHAAALKPARLPRQQ